MAPTSVDLKLPPKEPKPAYTRKFGPKEHRYLSFCEKFYFTYRKFPSVEQAATGLKYTTTEINYFLLNERMQKALSDRGLPWENLGATSYLTPVQIACATTIANFTDTRSINKKLEELGVQPVAYYAWLNNPTYQKFVDDLADRNLKNLKPEAVTAFAQLVRNGDFQAVKYYFEITGIAKSPEVQNAQLLIQRLVESVQRHVKDPRILSAISKDILGSVPESSNTVIDQIEPSVAQNAVLEVQ